MSRPVSAKMMAMMPASPKELMYGVASRKLALAVVTR